MTDLPNAISFGYTQRNKMATLEEFKALRAGVAPEVQTELYGLMTSDPEAGKQRRWRLLLVRA